MARVEFADAQRWYPGADSPAVKGLNLSIEDGEFMVLVGPSGCGKSTSLRMLAGLEEVANGSIAIGGRDVTHLAPKERDIAMVFQNYALYPHMTVADNMGFSLKMAKVSKSDRTSKVREAAALLGLTPYLDRKPGALSGGQRQRVAMGRAIVRAPQVFCMDEPLSNLDAKMRVQTRTDIAKLQSELGVTTVYVTHDQVEAMTMGHRVAVMNDGELQQVDTPLNLYSRPKNLFVAGFIGSPQMSLIDALPAGDGVMIGNHTLAVTPSVRAELSTLGAVVVGVRPEAWQLSPVADDTLAASVEVTEELGSDSYLYCHLVVGTRKVAITVRVPGRAAMRRGDIIHIKADPTDLHIFDAGSGSRIGV